MKFLSALTGLNSIQSIFFIAVLAFFGTTYARASSVSQSDSAERLGYSVKVQVLYFENSKWQLQDLEHKYAHVQRFFAKCDLFVDVEFVKRKNIFTHPVVFPGSEEMSSSQEFAESLPDLENTIYVIHVDEMADENGEFIQGISAPQARYGAGHALVHKNWVSYPSKEALRVTNIQNGLVEAHELAHDLVDSDHISESNNILTRFSNSWNITEKQCEAVRRHPKVQSVASEY